MEMKSIEKGKIDFLIGECIKDLEEGAFPDSYAKGRGIAMAAWVLDVITEEEKKDYCERLFEARKEIRDGVHNR